MMEPVRMMKPVRTAIRTIFDLHPCPRCSLRQRPISQVLAVVATLVMLSPGASVPVAAQTTLGNQGMASGQVMDDAGRLDFPNSRIAQFGAMHDAGAAWIRIELRLGPCFSSWTSPGCATAQGATALARSEERRVGKE